MKVVILAGGRGTRLSEETIIRPKPMVTIGEKPIIWHIMKIYSHYGFNEFIICCGYKGEYIKKYFADYSLQSTSTQFELLEERFGKAETTPKENQEKWKITLVNTGLNTLTAGRIKQIEKYIGDDEEFMITYGDGVADINIPELINTHHAFQKVLTISTTHPEGRFGALKLEHGIVQSFHEKARDDQPYVNIGYMVANKRLFSYLGDGTEMLEKGPFERIVEEGQLGAYQHEGFWSPMDNINDRLYLEKRWLEDAPWRLWQNN